VPSAPAPPPVVPPVVPAVLPPARAAAVAVARMFGGIDRFAAGSPPGVRPLLAVGGLRHARLPCRVSHR